MKNFKKASIVAIIIALFTIFSFSTIKNYDKPNINNNTAAAQTTGPICYNHPYSTCWKFPKMVIYGNLLEEEE